MSELNIGLQHVAQMLQNSPGVLFTVPGGLQQGVASEQAEMPFVLIQSFGDTVDTDYNDRHAISFMTVSVRVVKDADSLEELEEAYDEVHKALQNSQGTYQLQTNKWKVKAGIDPEPIYVEKVVSSCRRVNETDLAEAASGKIIRYRGGIYELTIS